MEYGPSLGGTPYVGQPIGLPINFGMRFSTEETAIGDTVSLTEDEKEDIILRCRDARSSEEVQKILDSSVPDGNVYRLFEHVEKAAEG